MKKIFTLTLCALLFYIPSLAQKTTGRVRGILQDSASAQPLSNATVSVLGAEDSSVISFTLSSGSGYFEIKGLNAGSYYALISYQGFEAVKKAFSITAAKPIADLKTIKMHPVYKAMQEVIIKDEAPIRVKGDTLSFDADAFKTRPNATAEDLLKKLPGMQVERDGTVKAQGETVQKIYVDGKEFFGDDPKMATKNLTADMIDRIELYNDVSDQSKFTGVDDGSRTKAINLKLKKDKTKGLFGRATAGYGTDDRYQSNVIANYFKGATKISVIARADNINNMGLTSYGTAGASNDFRGGGNFERGLGNLGITENWSAGLNYSDIWGKKTDITSSYAFNRTNNTNISTSHRQTFFPDSTVTQNQGNSFDNTNDNHRIHVRLNYLIDSVSSVVYTSRINRQNNESYRVDSTESFATRDSVIGKVSDSRSVLENTGEAFNWANNLLYRRRLSKHRRTLSINFLFTYGNINRSGFSDSRIGQYKNGNKTGDETINQNSIQKNNSSGYGLTISYTEPIGADKILEVNYSHNKSQNESNREAYDLNHLTGEYDLENLQQTNLFESRNESNRAGVNLQVAKKNYNYQLGLSVQGLLLQSINLSKNTIIQQKLINLFPTAAINYQFTPSMNMRLQYQGSTNRPGVTQLQDILIKDNPLYWTRGNAALKQEYTNNVSINYNFFNVTNFKSYFFNINFFNTYNKIVSNVISKPDLIRKYALLSPNDTIPQGVQLNMPLNANGVYFANGNFNIGFPINRMKSGNLNTNTTINYFRNVNFVDSVQNFINNLSLGEELRLGYNYKEKLNVGIGASIYYNSIKYTLQTDYAPNASYYTYAASADASYIFPGNFILSTDLDYTTNPGLAIGFSQSYFLWNASLSKQLFKNRRGELRLSVNDILNQNTNVSRYTADNYIEDVRNLALRRFAMLSFTYNVNRINGKQALQKGISDQNNGVNHRSIRRMILRTFLFLKHQILNKAR